MMKNRGKFWLENIRNFERNVESIIPKKLGKYKIYTVTSNFLGKKIMPYDYDSFSAVFLLSSSRKQGFEIFIFLNKARLGFLSQKALMYILRHEIEHIKQAIKNPGVYVNSALNDKISRKLENDAEKVNKEGERKTYALETVLYCFDNYGWKQAEKMTEFLFKQDRMYSGGYEKGLAKKEYESFLNARKNKNINIFISCFS